MDADGGRESVYGGNPRQECLAAFIPIPLEMVLAEAIAVVFRERILRRPEVPCHDALPHMPHTRLHDAIRPVTGTTRWKFPPSCYGY